MQIKCKVKIQKSLICNTIIQDVSTERPVLPPRQKRGRHKATTKASPPPQLPPKNKLKFPAKSLDNLDSLDGEGVKEDGHQEVPFERCQSYATNRAFDENNLGRGYEKTPFASESSMMYARYDHYKRKTHLMSFDEFFELL